MEVQCCEGLHISFCKEAKFNLWQMAPVLSQKNIKNFLGTGIFSFKASLNFTLSRPVPPPKQPKCKNPQIYFGNLFCASDDAGFSHINHLESELIALLHSPIKFPLDWCGDNVGKGRLKRDSVSIQVKYYYLS